MNLAISKSLLIHISRIFLFYDFYMMWRHVTWWHVWIKHALCCEKFKLIGLSKIASKVNIWQSFVIGQYFIGLRLRKKYVFSCNQVKMREDCTLLSATYFVIVTYLIRSSYIISNMRWLLRILNKQVIIHIRKVISYNWRLAF